MKYMGSKARITKEILPIILENHKETMPYWEPFVGGGNVIQHVPFDRRIGTDASPEAINALISIRDYLHELPKNNKKFTEQDYKNLRNSDYKHKDYAAFGFSFGALYLSSWRKDNIGIRDYVNESFKNAEKQSPKLKGVNLFCASFDKITNLKEKHTIYCDPPYEGTTGYKTGAFNHSIFWQWCRNMSNQGHDVFVSEYNAPDDFVCVWEKQITSTLSKNNNSYKKTNEKLFIFNKLM